MTTTEANPQLDPWEYPAHSSLRESKHRLAAKVRQVIEYTTLLDSQLTTPQALDDIMVACVKLQRLLAAAPTLRGPDGRSMFGPGDQPLVERGPISGLSNPFSPAVRMSAHRGETVTATAVFGAVHEGPPGMVHGGVLLMVFDEVLAFGQRTSGQVGMTGTVTVKLLGSVPIKTTVDFEAGTDRIEGRKKFVWAKASVEGRVAAEATAVCILARPA